MLLYIGIAVAVWIVGLVWVFSMATVAGNADRLSHQAYLNMLAEKEEDEKVKAEKEARSGEGSE